MNALPEYAVKGFLPGMAPAERIETLKTECLRLAGIVQFRAPDLRDVVSLPYEIDDDGTTPAQADDDLVAHALANLAERHADELYDAVRSLQIARWKAQKEDF